MTPTVRLPSSSLATTLAGPSGTRSAPTPPLAAGRIRPSLPGMPRKAIIASLALHAALLLLASWRLSSMSARTSPGQTGAGVSFFADDAAELLLGLPAAPAEPVSEPRLAEPDF